MKEDAFAEFERRLLLFIEQTSNNSPAPSDPHAPAPADTGAEAGYEAGSDPEFNELALDLFALQFTHAAPFQKLCLRRGVEPGKVKHWTEIPSMPTLAFKEYLLTSLEPEERTTVFYSSGTTGQKRSGHFHNPQSLRVYEASLWTWFCRHLLPERPVGGPREAMPGIDLLILTPPVSAAPNSSLVWMFDTVRRKCGAATDVYSGMLDGDGAWVLDFAGTRQILSRSETSGRPLMILGTAFLFLHLVDWLAGHKLRFKLPPGSRLLEAGGYKGRTRQVPKEVLQEQLALRLGIPGSHLSSEYGMSELSSQAYDRTVGERIGSAPARRIFRFPPWARVQIVSPENGRSVRREETGMIRVLDLANTRSVMAIQTEDLGIPQGPDADGGFELLGRAAMAESRGCSLMAG